MSLVPPINDHDHILGRGDLVSLVEYGDYECPHCGQAYPVVEQLREELGDGLRFVFRHFPLAQVHPHALQAAEAAECAGALGDFWGMHALLFENQDRLDYQHLRLYAQQLQLDTDTFDEQMRRNAHLPRVRADVSSGVRSGVNGTPTFFIDGLRYEGAHDFPSLMEAIAVAGRTRR